MMINRIKKLIIMLVFSTFCLCFSVVMIHADEGKESITIAILPCSDPVITYKKFYPLVTYLEQETGFGINLVVPKSLEEFESVIKLKNIDFAFQGPHTYVRLAHLFDQNSLLRALTTEGKAFESGVVVARKDSGIKKIEDLKGKTVMFGPRLSATKWEAAKILFKKKGINIDKDLLGYSNGGCCEDITFSVFLKKVDAGVTCDHFIKRHPRKQTELGIESGQLVIIGETDLVPARIIAARRGLKPDIIDSFNQALLRLDKNRPEHKKILNRSELGGFQESKDEDYDCMRMMIGLKKAE
ncbi:MAG: phosphate/phosphite/phosphonate ABC transporter substrate-binding protein [Desulfobacterales bacterium]|nr:phosphate/phosphite/phosphonate ABC transporter substrate-binding protein [Desulfobacterales bacterium]